MIEKAKKIKWKIVLSSPDTWVLLFILISAISTILSPYPFEAFWGNEGRYTGLFLLLSYVAVYLCMTRFYCPRQFHIEAFLIAGLLMNLHGITDFFGMDILHFKEEMEPSQWFSFTSTIGNINTYTACVALVMAVAGVLFATDTGVPGNLWHGICVTVSFAAIIMGASDNAYLSLMAFFGFLPLYLFRSWKGIRKYLFLLALFFSSVLGIGYVTEQYGINYVNLESIYEYLLAFLRAYPVTQVLWVIVLGLYVIEAIVRIYKRYSPGAVKTMQIGAPSPWLARSWWLVIAAVVGAAAFMLYDVNVAGHTERYSDALMKYLQFNDYWGSSRGYAWRYAVEGYKKFPLLQKIFGYGPDTYAIVTWLNNWDEMVNVVGVRFDSVHNEYLQYFVTIGPFGLLAYLGIVFSTIWTTVKRKLDNPLVMAALFAVICYHVQAVVNINQPIATPVMWVLLCMCAGKSEDLKSMGLAI